MSIDSQGAGPAPEQPDVALGRAITRRIAWHPWRLLLPAILFTLAIGSYLYQEHRARDDADFLDRLEQQVLLALQVARMTARAANDPDVSLELLRERHRSARELLENLYPPRPPLGLWPAPTEIETRLSQLDREWARLGDELEALTARQSANDALEQALTRFQGLATRMLASADDLVAAMTAAGEPPEQLRIAARQLMLIQRMLVNGERLIRGGKGRLTAADRFGRDAVLFGNVNNGLLNGNPDLGIAAVTDEAARDLLAGIGQLFRDASRQVQDIVRQSVELAGLQDAVGDVARASDAIVAATREAELMYAGYVATRPLRASHTRLLAGLAIATLLIAALLMAMDARAHRRNERQRRLDAYRRNEELERAVATAGSGMRRVGEELGRLMEDLGRVVEVDTSARTGEDAGDAVTRGLDRVRAPRAAHTHRCHRYRRSPAGERGVVPRRGDGQAERRRPSAGPQRRQGGQCHPGPGRGGQARIFEHHPVRHAGRERRRRGACRQRAGWRRDAGPGSPRRVGAGERAAGAPLDRERRRGTRGGASHRRAR